MMLAQRTFRDADVMRFASVSGDYNPIHVDALQARRTQVGSPVVHGIYLLLWALDCFAAFRPDLPPLCGFHAEFSKFVYPNECVEVVINRQGPAGARLIISVDGGRRFKIAIDFGEPDGRCPDWVDGAVEQTPFSPKPLNLTLEQISGRSGRCAFPMKPEHAVALFPAASRWFGSQRIAALAASTYLVGMVCPGLHSIYSELSIRTCTESTARDFLAFRVTDADSRFNSVEQEIAGGGLTGTIASFVRMPPVLQPTMESLRGVISPSAFAGSVALVVGGSRGLGELTAKLLATGGAGVSITWRSGQGDAERVAQEIRSVGAACEILAYDVCKSAAEQLAVMPKAPTHAYYFATPVIFRSQADIFAEERLNEFMSVYVGGFWRLVQALRARQPKLSIFYPSSVYVTERPKAMTEYSMSKAAGEVLCDDINTLLSPLHVTVRRLPRLPTDQTASITPLETADPLETMLPIIREVQFGPLRLGADTHSLKLQRIRE